MKTMRVTIDEAALEDLIGEFYARVRRDAVIGPLFNDAVGDWPEHLAQLKSFWSGVMLASGQYKGRPLAAHLRHGERISPASFERWLALWGETTSDMFEPAAAEALQAKAARIAESLQLGILFAKGDGLSSRRAGS